MAHDPLEHKQPLLADIHKHGLIAGGVEPTAAALGALIDSVGYKGSEAGSEGHIPRGTAQGTQMIGAGGTGREGLIGGGDAKGTYVIAVSATDLYVFTARKHHNDRVDERSGAWSQEPLGQTFVAWLPMQPGPEGHEGVLEIGERQFLIAPGDGAQAAAVAEAAQAARR